MIFNRLNQIGSTSGPFSASSCMLDRAGSLLAQFLGPAGKVEGDVDGNSKVFCALTLLQELNGAPAKISHFHEDDMIISVCHFIFVTKAANELQLITQSLCTPVRTRNLASFKMKKTPQIYYPTFHRTQQYKRMEYLLSVI